MTNTELAAFYRRYNACCNEHRLTLPSSSRATWRLTLRAFPDYRWELRRLVVDTPRIAAHFTDTGTHREAFLGLQATGRSVAVPQLAFYRVDAGQIAEVWGSAFHDISLNSP
jgi:predicted ester cyclase